MRQVVKVVCIFTILASIGCEEGDQYWKNYVTVNFNFRVLQNTVFNLDYVTVPILAKGSIADIPSMERLLVYDIKLQEIHPGAFKNLPNLRSLSITKNNISRIDAGVFNSLKISELSISENTAPLVIAADAFDNMTNLQTIRLDDVHLTTWNPHWFANTPNLKEIFGNKNLLETIPEGAFQNLNGDNKMMIFFYKNRIKKIHDNAFQGIKTIDLLSLQNNNMDEFSGNILKNIKITELRLSENKLRCLNASDFVNIFVAEKTAIGDNPWRPDCLQKILEWGMAHNKAIQTVQYF